MVNVTAISEVLVFDGRLRRPSSRPNEDDIFDGCETNFKRDLHNASLLDFSNIVEMTLVREIYIFRAVEN